MAVWLDDTEDELLALIAQSIGVSKSGAMRALIRMGSTRPIHILVKESSEDAA